MGAQAAALLDAGGPVGDVPSAPPVDVVLQLAGPPAYDLDRVARGHAGVGLAPSAYDGSRLHRVLPGGTRVVVEPGLAVVVEPGLVVGTAPGLAVRADGPVDAGLMSWVLCLDDDLTDLHHACDAVPSLAWVRAAGAGRVLRSPSAFEDLAATLASTNTSYAATRRMLAGIVRGAFPTPDEVLSLGEAGLRAAGWGYRATSLLALAARADEVERWTDPGVDDDAVLAGLRSLPGFGPFAAASALPLLGHRPRPLVLDGWLRRQVPDAAGYEVMGRWAGTGVWLALTRHRGGSERRTPRSPSPAGSPVRR